MQRLLVLETRMLGDAILSLPFVRGAAERYEVTVCCLPESASIFRAVLPAGNVITCHVPWMSKKPLREKWSDFARVTRLLCDKKFAVAVTVWPDVRLHLWMTLLGIPQRIGFPMNRLNFYGWQRPWRGRQLTIGRALNLVSSVALVRRLVNRPINKHESAQSHLACWRQIAKLLTVPFREDLPWMTVPALEHGTELFRFVSEHSKQGRPIWMIHPSARMPSKQWSQKNFQQLADSYFSEKGCALILIQPPDSPALAINCANQMQYRAATLADLAMAVNCIDGLLCNDSMISHLAAALGKKVVSVFGPTQISWFAPYRNEQYVVSIDVCPHRPCLDHCLMPSPVCLEQLDLAVVREKLDLALASNAEPTKSHEH